VASEERLRELEEKYEGYAVYDNQGQKIGKVDDLFVDEADREEYIGVKMGFLGRKSTLIPTDIVRVNERDKSVEVSESKDHVKNAPSFDDDEDITPDYEERIRSHFGLGASEGGRGGYGAYSGGDDDRDRELDRSSHGDHGSSEAEGRTDHDTSSEGGYGERTDESSGSSAAASGSGARYGDSEGGESSGEGSFDREGSGQGSTGRSPVTRQTEETETFEEGGRTKVRRRIIREEIVEEDADNR
jgi:sporulation protein YlmC with PRC-barrel domain